MPLSHRSSTFATVFVFRAEEDHRQVCSMLKMLRHVWSQGPGNERGLSRLMHGELHWLVIPQRAQYTSLLFHRCLRYRAPRYLVDCCVPGSKVPGSQHLRSARSDQLSVSQVRRRTFGIRAFSVPGPTVWNSLPTRDAAVDSEQFRQNLKTYLFAGHSKRSGVTAY